MVYIWDYNVLFLQFGRISNGKKDENGLQIDKMAYVVFNKLWDLTIEGFLLLDYTVNCSTHMHLKVPALVFLLS